AGKAPGGGRHLDLPPPRPSRSLRAVRYRERAHLAALAGADLDRRACDLVDGDAVWARRPPPHDRREAAVRRRSHPGDLRPAARRIATLDHRALDPLRESRESKLAVRESDRPLDRHDPEGGPPRRQPHRIPELRPAEGPRITR